VFRGMARAAPLDETVPADYQASSVR
jgi:hypothetical protein